MKQFFLIAFFVCSIPALTAQTTGNWRLLIPQTTYGIAINPLNPDNIVVGGLGRRLYRTHDAGNTWAIDSIEFIGGSSQLTNVLISAKDTSVILAGGVFNTIRRSTDQGKNWETVFETERPLFLSPGETIIADPRNPDIIYAGDNASNRVFRSQNNGRAWDTLAKLPVTGLCTLTMLPDSSNVLFAGCKAGIIMKSADSGRTWRQVASLRGQTDTEIPKIVFSNANPRTGYAVIAYFLRRTMRNGGLFKTEDGGETWQEAGWADTSFWSLCVAAQPGGKEEIFLGGYSDAAMDIPGPGIMIQKSQADIRRYDDVVPWLQPEPGQARRKNVWMLRAATGKDNRTRVYAATEAGFFVWEPAGTSVNELENDILAQPKILPDNQNRSISIVNRHIYSIKLFDMRGTLCAASQSGSFLSLPISLPAGIYTVQITVGEGKVYHHALLITPEGQICLP